MNYYKKGQKYEKSKICSGGASPEITDTMRKRHFSGRKVVL